MLATSEITPVKDPLKLLTRIFVFVTLVLKLLILLTAPTNEPLIFDTSITVLPTVLLNAPIAALILERSALIDVILLILFIEVDKVDNVVLKLLTVLLVTATTLLKLLIFVTAPESVPLIFVILLLVTDKLPLNTAKPGTVGAVAVPDKSPANCIVPKLVNVAGGVAVADKTLLST